MELCIMGRERAGRYHGFIQWAEQGGGGRHGDAGNEPQGSKVDVETRLATMVQTVISQEAGGQDREHWIVINSEAESRNYMIKYEEITMALVKKL